MKRFFIFFTILLMVAALLSGCSLLKFLGLEKEEKEVEPGAMKVGEVPADEGEDDRVPVESIFVVLKTNFGDIKINLFHLEAPRTVMNFANLAKDDFYDGTKFHRVIEDFMIQGGDPNSKDDDKSDDGAGGPGYTFVDEINPRTLAGLDETDIKKLEDEGYVYNYDLPSSHNLVRGVMAMANAGPNTNGSQFFILTGDSTPWLDGRHTVFGEVVEGMDVVDKINALETGENDYPVEDVILEDVEVLINEGVEEEAAAAIDEESGEGAETEAVEDSGETEESGETGAEVSAEEAEDIEESEAIDEGNEEE